ncbi:hypothetical protein V6N13_045757 [Hibiscus sabdariffa]
MQLAPRVISNGVDDVLRLPGTEQKVEEEDDTVKVFAVIKDIAVGKTIPIYFPYVKDPSVYEFFPREQTRNIPLSSAALPHLLRFFSFSSDSPQALAMRQALDSCETMPPKGEVKQCATSLESLFDFARSVFGPESGQPRIVRSSPVSKSTPPLQNYTVTESKEIATGRILPCHYKPYPYALYYCHFQQSSEDKVFMVSLVGDDGERVDAVLICHLDTSGWDADHISFRLLGSKPGVSEVCHFFPALDLVVIPS